MALNLNFSDVKGLSSYRSSLKIVINLFMSSKSRSLRERLLTALNIALIGLIPRMQVHVLMQVLFLKERLIAHCAPVVLDPLMIRFHMPF